MGSVLQSIMSDSNNASHSNSDNQQQSQQQQQQPSRILDQIALDHEIALSLQRQYLFHDDEENQQNEPNQREEAPQYRFIRRFFILPQSQQRAPSQQPQQPQQPQQEQKEEQQHDDEQQLQQQQEPQQQQQQQQQQQERRSYSYSFTFTDRNGNTHSFHSNQRPNQGFINQFNEALGGGDDDENINDLFGDNRLRSLNNIHFILNLLQNPDFMRLIRPNRPIGARQENIDNLPTDTYKEVKPMKNDENDNDNDGDVEMEDKNKKCDDEQSETEKCSICLEEFKNGETIRRLPCLHIFHKNEIDHWLRTNHICPICRAPIEQ